MKKLLTLFALVFSIAVHAQDTIVKIDSTRIIAKVTRVTDRTIEYTRYANPDGPVYQESRHVVARIIYKDGTVEHYGATANEVVASKDPNIITITASDFLTGVATLNYERVIGSRIGIRAIASMGIMGTTGKQPTTFYDNYYYSPYKLFSAGIDVHYYAWLGQRLSYYVGALMEFGRVRKAYYWRDFPPYEPYTKILSYYTGGITNGVSLRATTHITLDMFLTLGWRGEMEYQYHDLTARMGLSMGYRF